jgi:DNA helicase-2/ATP-dependent DNA helicase PcrA
VQLLDRLHRQGSDWPGEIDLVRQWYQPLLEQRYDDAHLRAADLDQLARIAATCATRAKFLTDLTLDPPDAASAEAGIPLRDEDYLILSTIHSAKGQEWKAVYVLNVVDGCIPSDMATGSATEIEEERRLLYVAMTRAKDRLMLMLPQRFYTHQQAKRGDRHLYAARSRFIPGGLLDRFELSAWPAAPQAGRTAAAAPAATVDLMARMRGRWQRTGT